MTAPDRNARVTDRNEPPASLEVLASMIRVLVMRIRRDDPGSRMAERAMEYLDRQGLRAGQSPGPDPLAAMTGTDRNDLITRVKNGDYSLNLEPPADKAEAWKQIAAAWRQKFEAMTADRDYWRAQAEQTYPGKGAKP